MWNSVASIACLIQSATPCSNGVVIQREHRHTNGMTTIGSNRLFTALLMTALAGIMVQMYRSFLLVPQFRVFALRVVSLFLEALPLLLAGAVVAAVAREILPSERIVAFCRRRARLGLPLVSLAGFLLPVDEHRLPDLMNRLERQGLPVPHIAAAALAIPLLNPVVIVSTSVAFPAQPQVLLARILGGMAVAVITGALLAAWIRPDASRNDASRNDASLRDGSSSRHTETTPRIRFRIDRTVQNTLAVFLSLVRYYLVAAVVVGLIQGIGLPASLEALRFAIVPGAIIAIGLGYLFSAPSAGDAFIARGLMTVLPAPALTGFLIVGPSLNLRTAPVFARFLRTGHLVLLHLAVFALALATALATALAAAPASATLP